MKLQLYISTMFIMVMVVRLQAQTEAMYSQYLYNKLVLNPAYAGSREGFCALLTYRHQWTNIEGAPRTLLSSFHTVSPNRKYGAGINLFHDRLSILRQTFVNTNFAYRFFIGKSTLALGLSGGLSHASSDISLLTAYQRGDVAAFSEMGASRLIPHAGTGIYFKNKKMAIGLSVPQIFNSRMLAIPYPMSNHFYFTFDYLITIGKQYTLEGQKVALLPSLLLKFVPNTNFQVDFNINLVLFSQVWLGMGYRSDNAYLFSLQYALNRFIKNSSTSYRLGYSYDLAARAYRRQSSGTHEILFMFDLSRNKNRILSPRLF